MAEKMDLKALEKKAFRSMHQDGLWDIYLGLLLLGGALAAYLENVGFYPYHYVGYFSVIIIGMVVLIFGKRSITVPRIGLAKFGPEREKKRLILIGWVVAVLVLTVALLFMYSGTGSGRPPAFLGSAVIMLMMVAIFSGMAYYLDYPRMVVIGVLFAMAEFLVVWFESQGWGEVRFVVAQAIPGAIILAMGLFHFIRFVRTHPVEC
jgi:hypothetical protein